MVNRWLDIVQFILLPGRCVLCGASSARELDLCRACETELPWNRTPCPRCALPLPPGTPAGMLCGECLDKPPQFDAARIPFVYAYPLDRLLQRLKFSGRLAHARILGERMAAHLSGDGQPRPDALVPIPLHATRLRERGFDQAAELARPIAQRLGVPLDRELVRRTRATRVQSRLDARERRRNVRGAFSVIRPPPPHVAILDDVVTTASTAGELARSLKRAGCERVELWACARVG